jgi:hypothetical protein
MRRFVHLIAAGIILCLPHALAAQQGQKWVVSWVASAHGPYPVGNPSAQPDHTRGCDGGIRKELAAGVRYGQTEGERAQIPDSNDGGFPDPHPGGWDHLVASGHQGIWLHRLSNRPKSH